MILSDPDYVLNTVVGTEHTSFCSRVLQFSSANRSSFHRSASTDTCHESCSILRGAESKPGASGASLRFYCGNIHTIIKKKTIFFKQ